MSKLHCSPTFHELQLEDIDVLENHAEFMSFPRGQIQNLGWNILVLINVTMGKMLKKLLYNKKNSIKKYTLWLEYSIMTAQGEKSTLWLEYSIMTAQGVQPSLTKSHEISLQYVNKGSHCRTSQSRQFQYSSIFIIQRKICKVIIFNSYQN